MSHFVMHSRGRDTRARDDEMSVTHTSAEICAGGGAPGNYYARWTA